MADFMHVGPWNPFNGHGFECECITCLTFWDSGLGTEVYEAWRRYRRTVKRHSEVGG